MNKVLKIQFDRARDRTRNFDQVTLGAAALTVIFWASAFAGIRAGLQSYSPESVALLRYLTASVCLAGYALLTRMPLPALRDVPGIALTGFLGFSFYNVALNAGEQRIPAGTASLIIASAPVFVALMAGAFYKERLRLRSWLGILLSFAGVAVISVKPQAGLRISLDAVIVLAAAVAQAAYTASQKPFLKKYTPLQFASYAIWAGALFLAVFSPRLAAEMRTASTQLDACRGVYGDIPGGNRLCVLVGRAEPPARLAGRKLPLPGAGGRHPDRLDLAGRAARPARAAGRPAGPGRGDPGECQAALQPGPPVSSRAPDQLFLTCSISCSTLTLDCSPVCMFFRLYWPSLTSSSPTMTAKGIPSLLA